MTKYDEDIDPLRLVGHARLGLHHHMAPATTDADSGTGGEDALDVDPLRLVGHARLGLHHHMAPATEEPDEGGLPR